MSGNDTPSAPAPKPRLAWRAFAMALRTILALGVLAAGAWIAYHWMTNKPQAERRKPSKQATLVEVRPVSPGPIQVTVEAMGNVVAACEIALASRVPGQLVEVSSEFAPGGRFLEGEILVQIERRDFELAVQQSAARLTQTEADLRIEMAWQDVARREYELLGEPAEEADEELLLRQPQLEAMKAAIAAARAALAKDELNLERTAVRAPFNAVVQACPADLGAYVGVGTPLATLIGTDEYWIEAVAPVDELTWIEFPGPDGAQGSPVRIYHEAAWGAEGFRKGRVYRLMPGIEPHGRMARLLISVPDPLDLNVPPETARPLLLGAFVRLEIAGREMPQAVEVPRTALHDGVNVWVMTPEGALDIRETAIGWNGRESVYIQEGLNGGDLLVTSDLAAPVQGMALRTGDEKPKDAGGATAKPNGPGAGAGRNS